jgi:hypothetical protein
MTDDLLITLAFLQMLILLALAVQILLAGSQNRRLAKEIRGVMTVQGARYALQVKLHREAKAAETLVPDALEWRQTQVTAALPDAALGKIDSPRVDGDLHSIELLAADGRRLVVSPYDAAELKRLERQRLARTPQVSRATAYAPLLNGKTGVVSGERSLLNAGDYFDLEAAQAGHLLNVLGWDEAQQLYFHVRAA